jgi:sec-independent protein translocase protein TatA
VKGEAVFLGEIFGLDGVVVVVVVAVLVFGGSAIPKLARNLGSAKTEFEKGLKAGKEADGTTDAPATPTEIKAPEADK